MHMILHGIQYLQMSKKSLVLGHTLNGGVSRYRLFYLKQKHVYFSGIMCCGQIYLVLYYFKWLVSMATD